MTLEYWKERLTKNPELRPWLERLARHAVEGGLMPSEVTLGDVPKDRQLREAVQELLGRGCREAQGRLKVRLDEPLREAKQWLPLAEALGLHAKAPQAENSATAQSKAVFRKLLLQFPDETPLIESMRNEDSIRRFTRSHATHALDVFFPLMEALRLLRSNSSSMTLSELGTRVFNDSKALRGGATRQLLERLLRLDSDRPEAASSELLNLYGLIENPYTTHVVLFAPLAYCTKDDVWLEWPANLFQRGEAAILSWEAVRNMKAVRLTQPCPAIVTSENSAPFHRLVERKIPSLYTEGYPNLAVKTLLRYLAEARVVAHHWGDADLDGYRIADQIARCIPMTFYKPPANGPVKPIVLDYQQRQRLEAFINTHPDFPYLSELKQTLLDGWIEQEQSI